ncbi:MAG: hypothetical protein ACYCXY_06340 [Acidimicrobiales bacterium]
MRSTRKRVVFARGLNLVVLTMCPTTPPSRCDKCLRWTPDCCAIEGTARLVGVLCRWRDKDSSGGSENLFPYVCRELAASCTTPRGIAEHLDKRAIAFESGSGGDSTDVILITTIHGAKGASAPLVITYRADKVPLDQHPSPNEELDPAVDEAAACALAYEGASWAEDTDVSFCLRTLGRYHDPKIDGWEFVQHDPDGPW